MKGKMAGLLPGINILAWLLGIGVTACLYGQSAVPLLSRLSADRNDPIYTTYTAAMERSEFILDEGYHFLFYDSSRGADFTTDTGGDLCLAFLQGMHYVYETNQYFRKPIIQISYPDLVRYQFFPFSFLKVDATFLVYSSHVAIWDLKITNESQKVQTFQVIPFLWNRYRVFNEVAFHDQAGAISFVHEELPDSWTLNHQIPYVKDVQNVVMISRQPQRLTSYRSYHWGTVSVPQKVVIEKPARFLLWGKIVHSNGERCRHQDPAPQFQVLLHRDSTRLLTETAPRWGSADPNISPYGFYGVELGNFPDLQDGDRFTLMLFCSAMQEGATVTDTVRLGETRTLRRRDLSLKPAPFPAGPQQLDRDIWGNGTEIRLFWKDPERGRIFHIFRRDYRREGFYRLLNSRRSQTFYTDRNIQGDQIYGYLVVAEDSLGRWSIHSIEINNIAGSDFLTDMRYPDQLRNRIPDMARVVALPTLFQLAPGQSDSLRIVRLVARPEKPIQQLLDSARSLMKTELQPFLQANEKLFARLFVPDFKDPGLTLLYWSSFNLMRQLMLPPEGKCSYNYYVFSREPQWGWGHGGQVFHESLTMLAYAFLDPQSAMDSQRIYRERQHKNGYINYRTGPYLDETIPYNNQLTTSAPWYAWQNWMLYQITRDRPFLQEMYTSSKAFYEYYIRHRDRDGDGLCEWGAHAVLESVRDARVAVWDEVGWPSHFEALDLNTMLVQEARSLAAMARELGKTRDARKWEQEARKRARKINQFMWDPETGFYYHVDKSDHDFTFKMPNDLKRQEIIGFLPLWAEIASREQAERLVAHLKNPEKFWRPYGIPSLAADDPYYNPKGYWNGPVWVEWNYLIVHGLLKYGYRKEARALVQRVAANMVAQLKKDHQFWEFYSPDEQWAGYHRQYIWAGLIARMLLDVYASEDADGKESILQSPGRPK